jgi:predicted aldo/keto reductase-like oxidoreductase
MSDQDKLHRAEKGMSRRQFIGSSVAAAIGFGLKSQVRSFGGKNELPLSKLKIKEYRILGRTGFKASDIGFGSGENTDVSLVEAVLDTGINYIDTAENYVRGQVERTIGKAVKNRNRKSVFITTKLALMKDVTKDGFIARARKCLERLETDYIDCLMIHAPETVEQLKNVGFHAAIKELKAEGRVRFCGVSNHGAQWQEVRETMEKVLIAAADDGRFDVMIFVYNFLQKDMSEKILKACQEKNIGAAIMKANPVGHYLEFQEEAEKIRREGKEVPEFLKNLVARLKAAADKAEGFKRQYSLTNNNEVRDAAYRFVLKNPCVNTVCCSIKNYNDLEAFVALSGTNLRAEDQKKLNAYAETFGQFYCRHACGLCELQCPKQVPVNTILRYNHYFQSQGREKFAMTEYARLEGRKADKCQNCDGFCDSACPYGLPVQGLLYLAHQTLTLR